MAHREGIRHRTARVIFRRRGGVVQILLQKRATIGFKDPGCYDISSAGHIPWQGSDYIPSSGAGVEGRTGVDMNGDELIYCGDNAGSG